GIGMSIKLEAKMIAPNTIVTQPARMKPSSMAGGIGRPKGKCDGVLEEKATRGAPTVTTAMAIVLRRSICGPRVNKCCKFSQSYTSARRTYLAFEYKPYAPLPAPEGPTNINCLPRWRKSG